jgi:hypothetical protein
MFPPLLGKLLCFVTFVLPFFFSHTISPWTLEKENLIFYIFYVHPSFLNTPFCLGFYDALASKTFHDGRVKFIFLQIFQLVQENH